MRPPAAHTRLLNLLTSNKGRGYHDVKNAGETADVYLYDEIGFWGTTAADFAREFTAIKAADITLHLNSPGGDAWDGQAIYHTIQQHPASVGISVDGIAASAASTIAMAASPGRLVMAQHAMMMVHEAWAVVGGNKTDLRTTADWLSKLDESIAGFYADRAGGDVASWLATMAAETWYSDREAVDAGLADLVDGDAAAASNVFDLTAFLNTPQHLQRPAAREADRKLTKRDAEQALRDAGMPAAAAKALVVSGWGGVDASAARDERVRDLAEEIKSMAGGR